jgi:hypothetical protein
MLRIEGAMNASFFQQDGSSRPGTEWAVGLKNGEDEFRTLVRSYLDPGVTAATAQNIEYQARTVMQFVWDILQKGWTPGDPEEGPLEIVIAEPKGGPH